MTKSNKEQEREFHYILMYNSKTKKWYIDEDTEGARFPEGNIWNATKQEWELGYVGEGEYTEGELENMDKVMKAISLLNEGEESK